jgi:putative ABC transport system permease protein
MMSIRWAKVFADIWSNRVRTILVVLSIAIGVFAVGATTNALRIISRDMTLLFRATNPASARLTLSPFDDDLARAVEGMREIAQVEPRRFEAVQVLGPGGDWLDLDLNVVADYDHPTINRFSVEAGQHEPQNREVILERATADWLDVGIGDSITIRPDEDGRHYTLAVVGIVHDLQVWIPAYTETGTGYVSMGTLEWLEMDAHYNQLLIVVAGDPYDKAHTKEVVELIRDRVLDPGGYKLYSSERSDGTHFSGDVLDAVLIILLTMGVMCVLLSAGLVINTVSALIARQIKQIGVMRTIGGTRYQIAWMYLAVVVILSAVALALAIPLGRVGSRWFVDFAGSQINFDFPNVDLPFWVVLVQITLGLMVSVGAGLVPVLWGTSITVYDAIYQDGNIQESTKGVSEGVLKWLKSLPGALTLAVRNTFRRKKRMALTMGTLTLAGATFIAAFHTHLSLGRTILGTGNYWQFDASLSVPGGARLRAVEREALRVEGVQVAEAWYMMNTTMICDGAEEDVEVAAVPPDSRTLVPALVEGRWLREGDTNAIVVSHDLLDDIPGATVGREVVFRTEEEGREIDHTYVVVGIALPYIFTDRVYAPYDYFTRLNKVPGQANLVRVRVDPYTLQDGETEQALAERLAVWFDDVGMGGGSTTTYYEGVVTNTGNFDMLLYTLMLMAGLLATVGGLGLAGTMSLNVMERLREIGVMRAIGATNASVREVILFEGSFIGVLSWALSAVLAYPLGMLLVMAIGQTMLGATVEYVLSPLGVVLWLGLSLIIATLASLAPAQYAAHLTVREVLAYE